MKDLDEEGDSVTASEAFEDFSGTDFGYALTSCFAALPIAAGIHYLTRVNSSMLLNIIGCGLLTFLLLGSIGGIVALDVSFCHHVSGIWAVGGLVIGLLDVALIQTIIGVVGASIS